MSLTLHLAFAKIPKKVVAQNEEKWKLGMPKKLPTTLQTTFDRMLDVQRRLRGRRRQRKGRRR